MFASGYPSDLASRMTTLIISNIEMNGIMKIVNSCEESGLLTKGVSERFKSEAREQNGGFLSMLLGKLGADLSRNLLTGKCAIRTDKGTITAGQNFYCHLIF